MHAGDAQNPADHKGAQGPDGGLSEVFLGEAGVQFLVMSQLTGVYVVGQATV